MATIDATSSLVRDLTALVGDGGVVTDPVSRAVYECDGYTLERAVPDLVVHPRTVEEVSAVMSRLHREGIPMVPRGAGTSLAGGCLAAPGSVVVSMTRLRAVEEVDPVNRQALVQAGVANLALSRAVESWGLHFAPDPSSQQVCTLGGNIANNSGGPHTLKLGVTTNHVLAVELVTPDGERRWFGSRTPATGGLDLPGLVVGNEGTFGVVTRAWVKLLPQPPAVCTLVAAFESVHAASQAVSGIIASGVIPAAVEMMDALILDALNQAFSMDFPPGAGALLLVEVDGMEAGLEAEAESITLACTDAGAFDVTQAKTDEERRRLWTARKRAFGAIGRLSRNYCTQDGVVPRTRLPEILSFIEDVGAANSLRIGNVFHAGDGNLHPIILYDERDSEEVERVLNASAAILKHCLELGGSLTGEHGIGVEKLDLMDQAFGSETLEVMNAVRSVFDPHRLANPNKAIPAGGGCPDSQARTPARVLGRVHPGRQAPQ